MDTQKKLYKAIIWTDGQQPGIRVSVYASNVFEAEKLLADQYGAANVFDLHNEEEASRVR
jgi:hypothetical protein